MSQQHSRFLMQSGMLDGRGRHHTSGSPFCKRLAGRILALRIHWTSGAMLTATSQLSASEPGDKWLRLLRKLLPELTCCPMRVNIRSCILPLALVGGSSKWLGSCAFLPLRHSVKASELTFRILARFYFNAGKGCRKAVCHLMGSFVRIIALQYWITAAGVKFAALSEDLLCEICSIVDQWGPLLPEPDV
eukprot:2778171-Amphidinium_carterae.1